MLDSQLFVLDQNKLRNYEKLYVVGDLHGDIEALRRIMNKIGTKNRPFIDDKNFAIFLGDYVDGGPNGIEVVNFMNYLVDLPNVVALRGNHEDKPCDLLQEIKKLENYETYFSKTFNPFRNRLYLAAIIPDEILFVHGGIYRGMTLYDLASPSKHATEKVIWSDPTDDTDGEVYNDDRGHDVKFGRRVTDDICDRLNVKKIIRGHDRIKSAHIPFYEHDGRVITMTSNGLNGGTPYILSLDPKNLSYITPMYLG